MNVVEIKVATFNGH